MTKSEGPQYEAPRSMRLSDAALGFGALCTVGSNAISSCLDNGASAGVCILGSNATVNCAANGNAAIACATGGSAGGNCIDLGSQAVSF